MDFLELDILKEIDVEVSNEVYYLEDDRLVSKAISNDIITLNAIAGNEDLKEASNYLAIEKFNLEVSDLNVATESFVTKLTDMIGKLFKAVIDFIKKVGEKIFDLFKKLWNFITRLFKKENSSGGGGGSVREKIDARKDEILEEITELKKRYDTKADARIADDIVAYADKHKSTIAAALWNNPTFNTMPVNDSKSLTSLDLVTYTNTTLFGIRVTLAEISSQIVSSSLNPALPLLEKDGREKIMKILNTLVEGIKAGNSTSGDKEYYHNFVTGTLMDDITELLTVYNGVITNANKMYTFGAKVGLLYNGKDIKIPDNIKSMIKVDDDVIREGYNISNRVIMVTRNKMTIMKTRSKNLEDTDISGMTRELARKYGSEDESYSVIKLLVDVFNIATELSNVFSIEFKTYPVTNEDFDIDKDDLDKAVSDLDVSSMLADNILDTTMKSYKNLVADITDSTTIVSKNLKDIEKLTDSFTKDIDKYSKILIGLSKDSSVSSYVGIEHINELSISVKNLTTSISRHVINPYKEFIGVSGEGSKHILGLTKTKYEKMYEEGAATNYSMLNLLTSLYGIKLMHDHNLLGNV